MGARVLSSAPFVLCRLNPSWMRLKRSCRTGKSAKEAKDQGSGVFALDKWGTLLGRATSPTRLALRG